MKTTRPSAAVRLRHPVQSADRAASPTTDDFTAHHDQYHDAIFRYCSWKCGDRTLGQDLSQDTFLRYWICLGRRDEILNVRAFLYRIAHNIIIDHFRRRKEASLDQLLDTRFEPTVDPWQHLHSQLDARQTLTALATMQQPYKLALQQRFILGLTPAEIGLIMGESPNAVSVRIFRGLKHLRVLLTPDGRAAAVRA